MFSSAGSGKQTRLPEGSESPEELRRRRRYARERAARLEAEAIAERVTADLYSASLELKRLNEELANANAVLENANQSIKEFVAVVSHDMRGPLTSILGYSWILTSSWNDLTDDKKLEFIRVVEQQGAKLNRLAEDLLTVSKIEAGAVEPQIQEIRIRTAIERIIHDLGEQAEGISIDADDDIRVEADPDHLERILANYFRNAVKYGAPPIVAEAREADGWVKVCVRDRGEGVPPALLPRLFEKFARADNETTRTKEGSGLGLSIVRGLARANGGDAWYEPNGSVGSCFGVTLRRAG